MKLSEAQPFILAECNVYLVNLQDVCQFFAHSWKVLDGAMERNGCVVPDTEHVLQARGQLGNFFKYLGRGICNEKKVRISR